ncbi:anti-sigma-I factor RsgI family protein [Marininema halotolerans]|uniref:Anti-sigma factor N-terminus n=1 Tax=Marininema halotolerans TaxID=1155944 RepID=A0A1I6REI3_9BACL|nr:anti-sigma factor domain-containing protein [Marininema halotolerans]SFS63112.1 Anti-sigma factor N-terminus [Marininema halotolerans]
MQRGIVMEVGSKKCVVMTPDGQFLTVPRNGRNVDLGDEFTFQLQNEGKTWMNRLSRPAWITGGVTVAALMLFMWLLPQWVTEEAHAASYVYIDLNPSLELGVNKDREVVKLRALNPAAKRLVKGMDWKGAEVKDVVVEVLNRAKRARYLDHKERVMISQIDKDKESSSGQTLDLIKNEVKDTPGLSDTKLDMYTLPLPNVLKKEAEENGISPVKYAVGLVARRHGEDLSIQELSNMSISELMKKVDLSPVLRHPPSDQDWTNWLEEDRKLHDGDARKSKDGGSHSGDGNGVHNSTEGSPGDQPSEDTNGDGSPTTPSLPIEDPVIVPDPPATTEPPAITEPPASSSDEDKGEDPPTQADEQASSGEETSSPKTSPNIEDKVNTP